MEVMSLLLFAITFSIALTFSMLSISTQRGEWGFVGMVGWFGLAMLTLILAPITMYAISYLFLAMGLIFLAVSIGYTIQSLEVTRKRKEHEDEWELLTE